ncbi:MAG TPA: thioredoxin [Nannocystis sp.]|jgi:thioredoxin 1
MASDKVKISSDSEFQADVLDTSKDQLVVVDFWATWCGPCRSMAPHLDAIAGEYDGKIRIVKVDVDRNQKSAITYGIQNLPTLLVFKGGEVVDKLVGNPGSKGKLEEWMKRSL